jgi:sulfatase maturation enzyme AslB (radical SAM superfamily)
MKSLRLDFLQGKEPAICNICFDRERATGQSVRLINNQEFKEVIDKIPEITDSDGSVESMKLKYWDFRFSNLCNFKCRSCVPNLSSSWIPDARGLGFSENSTKVLEIKKINDNSVYDFVEKNINFVEKIYFAGGEPLLMDEHWYIINQLVDRKKFQVKLYYSTNLSNLEYKNQKILNLWKLWPKGKIEICPSIDEVEERAELIRSGTNWNKLQQNLISLSHLDNLLIKPSITVSVFNVSRITKILDHFINLGIINQKSKYKNFHLNLLKTPEYYHVSLLDKEHKNSISESLKYYIKLYREKYKSDISDHFFYLINELTIDSSNEKIKKFQEITIKLDNLRKENTGKIIPEIAYLLNTY